jgi:hypothetical protein
MSNGLPIHGLRVSSEFALRLLFGKTHSSYYLSTRVIDSPCRCLINRADGRESNPESPLQLRPFGGYAYRKLIPPKLYMLNQLSLYTANL